MVGVWGHDSALLRLYWAGDNQFGWKSEWCIRPQFCIVTSWVNERNFGTYHTPGAGSIARTVNLQSNTLQLWRDCPLLLYRSAVVFFTYPLLMPYQLISIFSLDISQDIITWFYYRSSVLTWYGAGGTGPHSNTQAREAECIASAVPSIPARGTEARISYCKQEMQLFLRYHPNHYRSNEIYRNDIHTKSAICITIP